MFNTILIKKILPIKSRRMSDLIRPVISYYISYLLHLGRRDPEFNLDFPLPQIHTCKIYLKLRYYKKKKNGRDVWIKLLRKQLVSSPKLIFSTHH